MILRRRRNHLAIDLGTSEIRLLAIEGENGRARLSMLARQALPSEAMVAGEVMDYHGVADALKELRDRLGVKPRPAATSVAGRDVIVKRIKMDRMQEAEARQVIRWEAEQHVPFDMESVSLDFQILDPEADGLQMEVLLVAAKKELVETRIRLLGEAGFATTAIDVDAFAVQTAFEHNYDHAGYGTFCLMHVGEEITNLNVVEAARPLLTRDVGVGMRKLVEALVESLGVAVEEAERRLREWDSLDLGARQSLLEAMDGVITPIERARGFLQAGEGGGKEFDEIVLSGSGASIPGLKAAIADRLGVEVTVLDPLRAITLPSELEGAAGDRPALAVAVGLALRGRD